MKVNEFLEKYCLHDSIIDDITYDSKTNELIWHMDFAFWMQDGFAEGSPENGMINIHFHQVTDYTGITGKIDWFSVVGISANADHTITCTILDDYNREYYKWTFHVSDIEIENLYVDTTNL